jgi:hypothetical protein
MSVRDNPGRWLAGLLLALTASLVLAQGAPWVVKAVHGYRIALAVESVFESAEPGTDPRHARTLEHRLSVTVHEESSGRAAPLASIGADVAESGYSGTTIALAPARSGEAGRFEGVVRLSTKGAHRILIHATPAGGGRTLEAQFEYRHHH